MVMVENYYGGHGLLITFFQLYVLEKTGGLVHD